MFDALTLAAIVDELGEELVEGRVQRVQHIDELTLGFEVYARGQRRWLVLSADSQRPRILLGDERAGGDPDRITPLLLLLRKYVRGSRLLAVTQPRFERIVQFSFAIAEYPDEDDEDESVELIHNDLVVELMGRYSNIMLVDESGRIREAIKRVTPAMSRVRPIFPGYDYHPPPPQDKLDPTMAGPSQLLDSAAETDQPLDRWLVATCLALSPLLAREVAYRAGLEPRSSPRHLTAQDAERISARLRDLFAPLESAEWEPALYEFDDGGADFSAVRLEHLATRDDVAETHFDSVLEAALRAHEIGAPASQRPDRHAARRAQLIQEVKEARRRVSQRVEALQREQRSTVDPEELREKGELIYAYLWMIEPGQELLETPDGVRIELDPSLSANENAQEYFERYRKAQSANQTIPERIEHAGGQLRYLDQLLLSARQAETYDDIESVRLEWIDYAESTPGIGSAKHPAGSRPSQSARRPRRYETGEGDLIWIGRTGRQNDQVTFDIAGPDDLWLHAREIPGAHVILRPAPGSEASERAIEAAASLAAYYSDGRGSTRVPVDVTARRHVRKIRGAGPGMVTYRNEYTINVEPRSEDDLGLLTDR